MLKGEEREGREGEIGGKPAAPLGQINYTKCRRRARSVGHFMANLICLQKIEQKASGLNLMGVARQGLASHTSASN